MRFASLEEMVVQAAESVRPPERLTVSQAAAKYRFLRNEGSYVGPWMNEKTPYLVEPMDELTSLDFTGMIFAGPARTGKALALDTPIPTPSGWVTIGSVRPGDYVFGSDGRPTRVTAKSEVFFGHDCYRVTFCDGSSIVADADHKWAVLDSTNKNARRIVTTAYMADRVQGRRKSPRNRFHVENPAPLHFNVGSRLPLNPYILGLWLGDGHNIGARLASSSQDVATLVNRIEECGVPCRWAVDPKGKYTVYLSEKRHNPGRRGGSDEIASALLSIGMLKGRRKHIPEIFLTASVEDRLALLQGLLDTDGHADKKGRVEFCNTEPAIIYGVRRLLWSLGVKHTVSAKETGFNTAYRVSFTPDRSLPVFRFDRKQERLKTLSARGRATLGRRSITRIEKVASVPTQCISVAASDQLFVAGEGCVLTHNSDMFFNYLTYTVLCDPADMMLVHMTQATARDWSQGDLAKVFYVNGDKNRPTVVGERLVPGRQNDNVHDKRFVSGMRLLIKWPTITELSGKTIPRLWIMDYDRMDQDVDGEGNPFDLTKKRAQTFKSFGMCVAESSPGFLVSDPKWVPRSPHEAPPTDGILALYNRGDRRRWYWRCPQCREAFEPDFRLFSYPKSKDPMEAAEQVVMICPHDGFPMDPSFKNELNAGGRWVKEGQIWLPDGSIAGTARRSDIASFWLKGPAAAFQDWSEIVLKYLLAMEQFEQTGNEGALKTTVNLDQGLPYTPRAAMSDRLPEELKARAVDWGGSEDEPVVPEGARFLVATVDVQANAFVVQVHGIGPAPGVGFRVFLVDCFKIRKSNRIDERDPRQEHHVIDPAGHPEDWDVLIPQVIERTYPLSDGSGRRMMVKLTGCDSGGRDGVTTNAYAFYRRLRAGPEGHHRRFQLVKGEPNPKAPRTHTVYPDSGRKDRFADARGDVPVLLLNSTVLKDQAANLLSRKGDDGEAVSFPDWLPDYIYTQLTAEVRDEKGWKNPRKKRNEAFDLLYYAIGLIVQPTLAVERPGFWDAPPGWAAAWDSNDLVFGEGSNIPFAFQQEREYDLEKLASQLA